MDETNLSPKFREIMVRLQGEYIEQLTGHRDAFRRTEKLMAEDKLPAEDLQQLYRQSHDFAGSGMTFGFSGISRTGRDLHLAMKVAFDEMKKSGGDADPGAHRVVILECLQSFLEEIDAALDLTPEEAQAGLVLPGTPEPIMGELPSDIYFMTESGAERAPALAEHIRYFGYNVITGTPHDELRKVVHANKLKALVVFSDMSNKDTAAIREVYERGRREGYLAAPLIIISAKDDFDTRLAAARLGAQGFFFHDVDVLKLIDRVEVLSAKFCEPPRYNVMIVDDDKMLTEFYNHTLSRTGMSVLTVTDPRNAIDQLNAHQIDLLLIDFSMPGCNGQELASIIRQHEKYVSLPIVFISSYEDLKQAVVDTGLGIDDFLVKPFTPDKLFSVVRTRAQRAVELKSLMTRDSFTGLTNHAYFNEQLANELARVRRGKREAAYAMMDLDHFKSINDTYGHAAGDQVIKTMSRMLQQQLRRSDIIGRCGGEEFGVILPECSLSKAIDIIDKIRVQFSELVFTFGEHRVSVTLSAGVIDVDPKHDVDHLMKMADAALYTAKKQGRNQVRTFAEE